MARMRCLPEDENAATIRATIVLGAALGISFLLLIIAGAVFKNWLPMINLAAIVFIPISVILADSLGGGSTFAASYDESRMAFANFGSCFFGTVLVSMFGLPLVLLHTGACPEKPFGLWIASTVVTFFAAIYYWFARGKRAY